LAGDVQEINASLAIQLVFHWLNARGGELTIEKFIPQVQYDLLL
jgi:hypothetical protein